MILALTAGDQAAQVIHSLEPFGIEGLSQAVLLVVVLAFLLYLRAKTKMESHNNEKIGDRFDATHAAYLTSIEACSTKLGDGLIKVAESNSQMSIALNSVVDIVKRTSDVIDHIHEEMHEAPQFHGRKTDIEGGG